MNDKLISNIIDKHVSNPKDKRLGDDRKPLTVWLTPEVKNAYDQLQLATGKNFGKALNEITVKTIEIAKTKIAI